MKQLTAIQNEVRNLSYGHLFIHSLELEDLSYIMEEQETIRGLLHVKEDGNGGLLVLTKKGFIFIRLVENREARAIRMDLEEISAVLLNENIFYVTFQDETILSFTLLDELSLIEDFFATPMSHLLSTESVLEDEAYAGPEPLRQRTIPRFLGLSRNVWLLLFFSFGLIYHTLFVYDSGGSQLGPSSIYADNEERKDRFVSVDELDLGSEKENHLGVTLEEFRKHYNELSKINSMDYHIDSFKIEGSKDSKSFSGCAGQMFCTIGIVREDGYIETISFVGSGSNNANDNFNVLMSFPLAVRAASPTLNTEGAAEVMDQLRFLEVFEKLTSSTTEYKNLGYALDYIDSVGPMLTVYKP